MEELLEKIAAWLENQWILALVILTGSILAAFLVTWLIRRTLGVAARRSKTTLDDRILEALDRPIFLSTVLYGLSWVAEVVSMPDRAYWVSHAVLKTLAAWVWAAAGYRIGRALLDTVGSGEHAGRLVQERTLPVFGMLLRIAVVTVGAYFVFLAWDIDLTAWLASAGIIGIAIGFAAKDTLANLFSGIFIIADAPYKLGDYIVLDDGLRGKVTRIGVRSTRILTRDDVEITVPNAVIGNTKIINEAGGPGEAHRVRVAVDLAYGTKVEDARRVLLSVAAGEHIAREPEPRVRFRRFGPSGLAFELLVWIERPELRGRVLDALNTRVYDALGAAGIEIPYAKTDVYIRQMPAR